MSSIYIKQYSVKIKSDFGKEGTGVIIKQNNMFYLATAKHNFTNETGTDTWKYVDAEMEEFKTKLHQIKVFENNEAENLICTIDKIFIEYQDFIIFEIKEYTKELEDTQIFYNELTELNEDETQYFIQGYSKSDGDSYIPRLHSINPLENYQYTLIEPNNKRIAHLQGLSGSGVFVKINNFFYLVGILLQKNDDSSNCYIFNLPKYLKENHKDDFNICNKDEIFIQAKEKLNKLTIINTKNNFENIINYGDMNFHNYTQSEDTNKNISVDAVDKKQSHIIPRDGYIEPRTVYIDELDIYVAVCPVTVEEYNVFCKDTNIKIPYGNSLRKNKKPVVNVDWNMAKKYCIWLKEKTNKNYRLFNSEDWEFIALLNMPNKKIKHYIVCRDDFKKYPKLCNVKTKKVGNLNIFDMPGNIYEWTNEKIIKGSSFNTSLKNLNICRNESFDSYYYNSNLGFRLIL